LSERNELLNLAEIIDAVEYAEAISRKPDIYGNVTFFGANDEWLYTAYNTANTCDICDGMNGDTYYGYELRQLFPYLVIVDENTIYAKVHPRCACVLSRVFPVEKLRLWKRLTEIRSKNKV
jgi:hypothetical protein